MSSSDPTTPKSATPRSTPDDRFTVGKLLVAMPNQTSAPFACSVIYMCAHSPDGAMGLIVNQPLPNPSFVDVMRQLKIGRDEDAGRQLPLVSGGPVQTGRGFVLHSADWLGESSLQVTDTIAMTTSLDILQAVAAGEGPEQALMALGYAGWGAGQLDREIVGNAWLSVTPTPALVFGGNHADRWRDALATLHIDPLMLSTTAGHA